MKTRLTLFVLSFIATVSPVLGAVLGGPLTNAANSHVYYLLDSQSWSNSEAEALSLGGHLVTINDAAEQDFVLTNFANFGGTSRNLWIGLGRSATNYNVFVWASGQSITYAHWAVGEPSDCNGIETKVMIYGPALPAAGFWNDATELGRSGCDNGDLAPLGVVEVGSDDPPPIFAGPVTNAANGHLYYLISSQSWSNAEEQAISLGGHLVTINDAAEQNFVYSNFSNYGESPRNLWIGLRRNPANNFAFIWSSGQPVTYTHWASGEPSNCGGTETKALIYGPLSPAAGLWNDATELGRSGCDSADLYPLGVVEVDCAQRSTVLTGPLTNSANSHVYYLLASQSWSNAEAEAVSLGGHLVTISDAAEEDYIYTNFSAYAGVPRNLWIGLERTFGDSNTFVWASGQPVAYTHWAPGEPSNCAGIETKGMIYSPSNSASGLWNDATDAGMNGCTNENLSPLGVVEVEPVPVSPIVAGPITNSATAHVYYLLNSQSWSNSEALAVSLGGHLVTINDATEQGYIYTNFANYGGSPRNLWIGLRRSPTNYNTFIWASGQPVSYTHWATGEPSNCGGKETKAMMYSPSSPAAGFWNDATELGHSGCNDADLSPFGVVEIEPAQVSAIIAGPITNAADGHAYYLINSQSWSNSEAQAVSLGGHLVTINDAAEQTFVFTNFANYGGTPRNLWIGLRRNPTNYNTFVWASGQPVTYTHWAVGEPNDCGLGETKGMIYAPTSPAAGQWNDATELGRSGCNGADLSPYGVVEIGAAPVAPTFVGPVTNSANGHLYYLVSSQSWSNAEDQAVSLGGHLVTLNDGAEQDFVYTNFANYGGTPRNLWIGLRRSAANNNIFVWASGQSVTYTHWASGEPSNCGGTETKAMIYGPSSPAAGLWNDATELGRSGCDNGNLSPFGVIEVDPAHTTTVLVGPLTNSINFHVYYLLASQSWSNAEAEAISLGGHLVTINDAAEQEFVYTNFANFGGAPHNLWIGFRRDPANHNQFIWASGQPVTYTHWAPGEPNNCGGTEAKGIIYAPSSPAAGLWNDATELGRSGCDNGDLAPLGVVELDDLHLTISVATVNLCWNSLTNHHYQLEYESSDTGYQWTPLGSPILATNISTCVNGVLATPMRFYRVLRVD